MEYLLTAAVLVAMTVTPLPLPPSWLVLAYLSVELDAIPPANLRSLVEVAIRRHLPLGQLKVLKAAEESERALLNGLVGMLQEQTA